MSCIYLDFSPTYDSSDNLLPSSRRSRRSSSAITSVGIRATALDLQKDPAWHYVGVKHNTKCYCGDVEHGIYWQEQNDRIKRRKAEKERKLKDLEKKQQEEQLLKEKERREKEEIERREKECKEIFISNNVSSSCIELNLQDLTKDLPKEPSSDKLISSEWKAIAIVPSAPLLTRPSFVTGPIEEKENKQVEDSEFSSEEQVTNLDPCLVEVLDTVNGKRIFQEEQDRINLAIGLMKSQPEDKHSLMLIKRKLKREFVLFVFDPGGCSTCLDSRSNPLEEREYDMNSKGATPFWVNFIKDRQGAKKVLRIIRPRRTKFAPSLISLVVSNLIIFS